MMRNLTLITGALLALVVASPRDAFGQAQPAKAQDPATPAPADTAPTANPTATATAAAAAEAAPPSTAEEAALASDFSAALSEQIVTGASRAAETASEAPATTSTIRADELRRYGIRTVAEALNYLSLGVFTIGGQSFELTTLGARGVGITGDSNNHFLLVIDGSVVNEPRISSTRPGWPMGLPLEMIDTIEVILGGGSVLYGGSAMLGVINIKTKPARFLKGVRLIGEFGYSPSQNALNEVKNWDPSAAGTSPRLAAAVGHEFTVLGKEAELTGEFEWAHAELPDTYINQQNQSPRVGTITVTPWGGGPAKGLVLEESLGGYSRVKVGRWSADTHINYHRAPLLQAPTFEPKVNRVEGVLARFDTQYNVDLTSRLSGFARLYLGRDNTDSVSTTQPYTTTCTAQSGATASRCGVLTRQVGTWQGLELQGTYDFLGDGRLPLMIGVDGRLRQVGMDSQRTLGSTGETLGSSGGMQSHGVTMSAYIQQRAKVASWLSLHAGVRYDFVKDSGSGYPVPPTGNPVTLTPLPDVTNDAASPRFAILLFPTKTTTIHMMAGTSFRAPTPQELFYSSSAFFTLPKSLQPETVRTAEIGVRQSFGVHRGLVAVYASEWRNLIGIGGTTISGISFRNAGKIENYGVNAALEGSFVDTRLQYGLNFTFGYARKFATPNEQGLSPQVLAIIDANRDQAQDKTPLAGAPEAYGNAHISYDLQGDLPVLGLASYIYSTRSTNVAYSDAIFLGAAARGPATTNAGGYQFPSQYQQSIDVQVGMRATVSGALPSLTNWRYRIAGDYLAGGGNVNTWGPTPGGTYPQLANIPGHPGFNGQAPPPVSFTQFFPVTRLTIYAGLEVQFDP
jgi:outer membrane receptor for ferrienterochelin and colicins